MKRVGLVLLAGVALFVGGPWFYINVIRDDAPEELSLSTTTVVAETTVVSGPIDPTGVWVVGEGSVAGYRVDEILFGQNVTAVGRTSSVSGQIEIDGQAVVSGSFSVDLTSVRSDSDRRDSQFANRIMDVLNFPTADFRLTSPIQIPDDALESAPFTAQATGELSLRGTSRAVVLDVTAQLTDGVVEISTSAEVVFAEWGIPDPSLPGVSTEDFGMLEVLLRLVRS